MIDFAWNVAEGCLWGLLAFVGYVGVAVFRMRAAVQAERNDGE
jgi:hypothetical protein